MFYSLNPARSELPCSVLRPLALLLREVMAGSVILPTMDFMADPVSLPNTENTFPSEFVFVALCLWCITVY